MMESPRGLGLDTHGEGRQRLRVIKGTGTALDTNLTNADIRKLRWIARKRDRSVASLIRVIVKEWLDVEQLAGEFRGYCD